MQYDAKCARRGKLIQHIEILPPLRAPSEATYPMTT
jgi:hypothetical protein